MLIGADKHFKNVFSIKRILAVVIKEVVDIYRDCEIDEIVGLINSVSVGDVKLSETGVFKRKL